MKSTNPKTNEVSVTVCRVHLVYLVYLVCLVCLVSLVHQVNFAPLGPRIFIFCLDLVCGRWTVDYGRKESGLSGLPS